MRLLSTTKACAFLSNTFLMMDTAAGPCPGIGSRVLEPPKAGLCRLVECSDGPLSGSVPGVSRWDASVAGCPLGAAGGQAKPVTCSGGGRAACTAGLSHPGPARESRIPSEPPPGRLSQQKHRRLCLPHQPRHYTLFMFKMAESDMKMDRGWLHRTEMAASLSL